MLGLSYAAVPLYDLFCRVTGFGGTTQISNDAPKIVLEPTVWIAGNSLPTMLTLAEILQAKALEEVRNIIEDIIWISNNFISLPFF